jgi:diketogulonate reductase-like aldo/keto reductase
VTSLPTVSLPGTGITTSVLGFGCSRLLGPKSVDEALGLLETAYDSGIRHFDVAPAYGSGDAEGVLGRFIEGRREEVTVTTKFGIQPRPAVAKRRILLGVARRLMKTSPGVHRFLGRQGAKLVKRGGFTVEEASRSLETSLRQLRTDYVDLFLLHDCDLEDCSPELLEFLSSVVTAGKIRTFGVGTSVESAASIRESVPEIAGILQFEHSLLCPTVDKVDPSGSRATITHGALADLGRLRAYLATNEYVCSNWSAELGLDLDSDAVLAGLMLQYAVRTNTKGPVLFSSTKPENVAANAAAAAAAGLEQTAERAAVLISESPFVAAS